MGNPSQRCIEHTPHECMTRYVTRGHAHFAHKE